MVKWLEQLDGADGPVLNPGLGQPTASKLTVNPAVNGPISRTEEG